MSAEDISKEIFSGLLNELRNELDTLLTRDLDPKNEEQKSPGLGNTDKIILFDRQGIKTDLFAIEKYVDEVLDEVMDAKDEFKKQIEIPLPIDS